jgi:hypothetical protein
MLNFIARPSLGATAHAANSTVPPTCIPSTETCRRSSLAFHPVLVSSPLQPNQPPPPSSRPHHQKPARTGIPRPASPRPASHRKQRWGGKSSVRNAKSQRQKKTKEGEEGGGGRRGGGSWRAAGSYPRRWARHNPPASLAPGLSRSSQRAEPRNKYSAASGEIRLPHARDLFGGLRSTGRGSLQYGVQSYFRLPTRTSNKVLRKYLRTSTSVQVPTRTYNDGIQRRSTPCKSLFEL